MPQLEDAPLVLGIATLEVLGRQPCDLLEAAVEVLGS
jgi:hypothetical protein